MNLEKKLSEEDKKDIEAKIEALKEVKDGEDIEAIKKSTEELTQAFYAVTTKIYQAEAAAARSRSTRSKMQQHGRKVLHMMTM